MSTNETNGTNDPWEQYGTTVGTDAGGALDWDSEIEKDGGSWTLLPEGVYPFTVTGLERAWHGGSANLTPCPKASLTIKVEGPEGSNDITHNLFLHNKTEGLLCAFFIAIGQRQHGERLKMDWGKVIGSKGQCKVSQRKYISTKDGEEKTINDIQKFLEPPNKAYQEGMF